MRLHKFIKQLLLVVGCIAVWSDQAMTDELALPQFKSIKEQQILEHQALQGSPVAADKIVGVLGLFPNSDAFYWANIAVENSSRNGASNMASFLADVGMNGVETYGIYRLDREYFWLKKAGNANAEFVMKEEFPQPEKMQLAPEQEIKQWKLSNKTLSKFKRAAMLGSPQAAYRMYQHYSSLTSEPKEGLFWAIIAAQNGHPNAPLAVGKLMLKSSNQRDHVRAQFWLRKAAATGDNEAAKLLEKNFPSSERR